VFRVLGDLSSTASRVDRGLLLEVIEEVLSLVWVRAGARDADVDAAQVRPERLVAKMARRFKVVSLGAALTQSSSYILQFGVFTLDSDRRALLALNDHPIHHSRALLPIRKGVSHLCLIHIKIDKLFPASEQVLCKITALLRLGLRAQWRRVSLASLQLHVLAAI